MGLAEELLQQQDRKPEQSSWIKDLISQRYQPKTERLKRSPVGFDFKRDPFDPSTYYKQLGSYRDISKAATGVVLQEASNRKAAEEEAQRKADLEAQQRALGGVSASFTYSSVGGTSKKYGLKGVTATTSKAADYFGSKYGIRTIGGRGPGSVPGSDHPNGKALDYMINNLKNGKAIGTSLANDVIQNYKAWNVKYVIWNKYIWTPSQGWHKYSGPSDHTDHVHVSFNS